LQNPAGTASDLSTDRSTSHEIGFSCEVALSCAEVKLAKRVRRLLVAGDEP